MWRVQTQAVMNGTLVADASSHEGDDARAVQMATTDAHLVTMVKVEPMSPIAADLRAVVEGVRFLTKMMIVEASTKTRVMPLLVPAPVPLMLSRLFSLRLYVSQYATCDQTEES